MPARARSASASIGGYGMPAWCARAALRRLWRARAMFASMARASMRPGRMVRTGDVITVALDRRVRVLKVTGFVERRGPAGSAATLYEDLE